VKSKDYIPDKGDVVWIIMNPQAGHEQAGRRPALVLSPTAYNGKTGLALLCPITNQIKGYPFEVSLTKNSKVSGAVLADQIKSLDWRARRAEFCCKTSKLLVSKVKIKVDALLNG
jgi:mRNA interferase MazF